VSGRGVPDGGETLAERRAEIALRRRSLEGRLEDGYRRIEDALEQGADVAAWEGFWIGLLREYEEVCEELRPAA
jgi:hypothetical protein